MKTAIILLLVSVCCIFAGCKRRHQEVMSDKELKSYVEVHLKKGDSKETIEKFFQDNGWQYSFNEFEPRYEVHYKPGDVDTWFEMSGVGIFVYINEKGLLKKIEIDRAYTGL